MLGMGGAQGRYHLHRDFQLRLLSPSWSSQGWERSQQVLGFAAQAVVPRAPGGVGAGPRGEAVPPHPHRALPAGEVQLIPHTHTHTEGVSRNGKGEAEFKGMAHTCSTPPRLSPALGCAWEMTESIQDTTAK